ncbi:phosphoribosylformylglycinamidine synthase, purS protein, partial [candidate division KSB1 bacterium]
MGYKAVNGVRVGKFVTLELNSALTEAEAYQQMEEMCQKLLANPIIEDYRFEIEKVTEEQE